INRSWEAYSRDLYIRLIEPIREHLGTANMLLVAPDSTLNVLPLGALLDRENAFLLETYQITYLTSGRDLLRMQSSELPSRPPLLFANPAFEEADAIAAPGSPDRSHRRAGSLRGIKYGPLPFAEAEAEAIAPLFPAARTFIGADATETQLKQVRSPQFLHLATHGFFEGDRSAIAPNSADPATEAGAIENPLLLSGLALAGFNNRRSGNEDGVLTALEVTGLDLQGTELVVLSACETGLGRVEQGEGVYGLRRAFTLAGAQSQLMSLWNVDDESTRILMEKYYQHLQQGEGRSEALRQAQLEMMRDPYWSSPYFWAAFVPTGNWRSLSSHSHSDLDK
ncbi:MAG: CHAT domain-containing protein, partial [Cyanobacteria bacterium J06648_11]